MKQRGAIVILSKKIQITAACSILDLLPFKNNLVGVIIYDVCNHKVVINQLKVSSLDKSLITGILVAGLSKKKDSYRSS